MFMHVSLERILRQIEKETKYWRSLCSAVRPNENIDILEEHTVARKHWLMLNPVAELTILLMHCVWT